MTCRLSDLIYQLISSHTGGRYDQETITSPDAPTDLFHHIQGDVMTVRLSDLIHRLIASHTGGRYDRETIRPDIPAYLITYRRTLWPGDYHQSWCTHRLISSHTGGRYDRETLRPDTPADLITYRGTLWPGDYQSWYTGLSHHIQGDVMTGRLSVLIHRLISSHTGGRYDRETLRPDTPAYLITYRGTLWPGDYQSWYTGLSHHIQGDVMTGRLSVLIHRLISSHTGGRYDRETLRPDTPADLIVLYPYHIAIYFVKKRHLQKVS